MADPLEGVEEIHLPLPPPITGALTAGPYNFQFTGEDSLRLSVANALTGVVVSVHYRTAPTPTTIQTNKYDLAPSATRVVNTSEFSVGEGYLLNVVCFASSGSPKRGQTFAKLEVIRGNGANAIVLGCIFAGYLTANQPIAWPGSPIESSTDGDGFPRTIVGTLPALAANFAETVPTNARWELKSVRVELTAGPTVANRLPRLQIDSGEDVVITITAPSIVTATQRRKMQWATGLAQDTPFENDNYIAGIPIGFILLAGQIFEGQTNNLQADDQYARPVYDVHEWLEV